MHNPTCHNQHGGVFAARPLLACVADHPTQQVFEQAGPAEAGRALTLSHPAALKDRVTSPAGTTIAGLTELEAAGVRGALIKAVKAAADRAGELERMV